MRKSKVASLLALVAALWIAVFPVRAADPIIIKFSHVVANDTPKGKAAEKFKQLAEKYTAGRVKVELYPNSQLYKDREEMEALQRGAVQMLAPSVSKFGPMGVREFELFDIPYLIPDAQAVDRVTGDRREAVRQARTEGCEGPRVLGQWLQAVFRESPVAQARGLSRIEDAHPVIQSARSHDARVGRAAAGDGLLRSLLGAPAGRCRWNGESDFEPVHAKDA
jgi:TRAP-type C4-dicarboxylate transport system substrate-binding protein